MKNINFFNEFYLEFNLTSYNLINNTFFEFVLIKTNRFIQNTDIYTF